MAFWWRTWLRYRVWTPLCNRFYFACYPRVLAWTIAWRYRKRPEMAKPVCARYLRMDLYKREKWRREYNILLSDSIAEAAEEVGVPQHVVRQVLEEELHVASLAKGRKGDDSEAI